MVMTSVRVSGGIQGNFLYGQGEKGGWGEDWIRGWQRGNTCALSMVMAVTILREHCKPLSTSRPSVPLTQFSSLVEARKAPCTGFWLSTNRIKASGAMQKSTSEEAAVCPDLSGGGAHMMLSFRPHLDSERQFPDSVVVSHTCTYIMYNH